MLSTKSCQSLAMGVFVEVCFVKDCASGELLGVATIRCMARTMDLRHEKPLACECVFDGCTRLV